MLAEVCSGPLFHCPHWYQVVISTIVIAALIASELLPWAYCAVPINVARTLPSVLFNLLTPILRDDLSIALLWVYILWLFLSYPSGPTRRFRKRIADKWSSLTEVMRTSLARQQQEAA